ncbi:MAG: hypothetical protein LBR08_05270 [Bacteroidales bacterium]|jgi:hypothetical protein|nr:hypothetical protein [Bacteroidales bacterium]
MEIRIYNCKDVELPFICRNVAVSFKRDLAEFTAYSPMFGEGYVVEFENKIHAVSELLGIAPEAQKLKDIINGLHASIDGLIDPINRLKGYVQLSKDSVPLSLTDFGVTPLRKKISLKDAKGIFEALQLVNENLQKYKPQLAAQGMTNTLMSVFAAATKTVTENYEQHKILSKRREQIINNIGMLNALYRQLMEILSVGKILYKGKKPEKLLEYTFAEVKTRTKNELLSKHLY